MTAELLIAISLMCQGGGPGPQKECVSKMVECLGLNSLSKNITQVNECIKKTK
jgi:hypothetical protein